MKNSVRSWCSFFRILRPRFLAAAWLMVSGPMGAGPQDRTARESWWDRARETTAGRYSIKTDLPAQQAELITEELNRAHDRGFIALCGPLEPRERSPLLVWAFSDAAEMALTLRARQGADVSREAVHFVEGTTARVLVCTMQHVSQHELRRALRHEAFHQFARKTFGGDLPWWAQEGLAQLFERGTTINGKTTFGEVSADDLSPIQKAVDKRTTISFAQLIALPADHLTSTDDETRAVLHDQAFFTAIWLTADQNRTEWLQSYLKLINSGLDPQHAAQRAFGRDFAALDAAWRSWVLQLQPSVIATAAARIEFLAQGAYALAGSQNLPQSLEDLRAKLVVAQFSTSQTNHGRTRVQDARTPELYQIPLHLGRATEDQPVFIVERPNLNAMTKRQQHEEQQRPTPAVIRTRNLGPRELMIVWRWNDDAGEWSWTVRDAPAE